jgi:hypothetical protein
MENLFIFIVFVYVIALIFELINFYKVKNKTNTVDSFNVGKKILTQKIKESTNRRK